MPDSPPIPSVPGSPAVSIAAYWWALGVVDGFNRRPVRAGLPDELSYYSGRVEGEAARLQGSSIDAALTSARLPYREIHFRDRPPLSSDHDGDTP